MSSKAKVLLAVLLTFSLTCLMFVGIFNSLGISVWGGRFKRLEAVGRIIESRYIGEFDVEKAEDAAINAMIATIDDPYSQYYDEESTLSLETTINGNYKGIGIEVATNTQTGEIVVITAYYGGPAQKAGIKSGDVLTAIDGVPYDSSTMDDAVAYMKGIGVKNDEAEITVTVNRDGQLMDLKMKREEIDIYSIEQKPLEGGVLYLRYTGFSAESAKKLKKILNGLDEATTGIILDLRDNPGGDMEAAVDICDLFLDDGMIMYTEDKNGKRNEEYATPGACDLPLAVLVDGGTASASEIVAGCFQARERAVIVGEKTYGKGVSQLVCALGTDESSGLLKVTSYKNFRPDGIWLNEGVTPDIEAASNPTYDEYGNIVYDTQGDVPLSLALEALKK